MINIEELLRSDRRQIAKAITLIESTLESDQCKKEELLRKLTPKSGTSTRIGISGPPGAGKSSLIELLGIMAINQGHNVAVLAVDPSSQLNKGSILGDKTRMPELSISKNAFIRPSPSRGHLGGIGRYTHDTITICEAAGYNYVIIETVGVGQSEIDIAGIADISIVLQLANTGDELQGIKRGILEIADIVAIHKADISDDLPSKKAKSEIEQAINMLHQESRPPVLMTSIMRKSTIEELWRQINQLVDRKLKSGRLLQQRNHYLLKIFHTDLQEKLIKKVFSSKGTKGLAEKYQQLTLARKMSPSSAANRAAFELFQMLES